MDKSIPYLLTLASDMEGTDRFLDSLENTTPMEHIPVQFQPWNNKILAKNIANLYCHDIPFPGHFNKWKYVPEGLDLERYVIFSDTSDVVFQEGLPRLEYDLYLAPENVDHRNTMWKEHIEKFPSLAPLMDREVLNCGTFAMKVKTMYEYRDFIYSFDKEGYGSWEWKLEQIYFNMFVYLRKDLSRVLDRTIFCPLFANTFHGVKKAKDGIWEDNGKIISCVHANGDENLKKQL